jgi:hypothetical protein
MKMKYTQSKKQRYFTYLPLTFLFIILALFSCKNTKKVVHSLDPAQNSHIVFIGNTFAERLQDYNYLETF